MLARNSKITDKIVEVEQDGSLDSSFGKNQIDCKHAIEFQVLLRNFTAINYMCKVS